MFSACRNLIEKYRINILTSKGDEMKVTELGVKELRTSHKKLKLTNQEIIKFAYITKEIINYAWGVQLTNAQANCYEECFYTIKDLLEEVDKEYLNRHAELRDFFSKGRRLISEDDRLRWEKEVSH
jgi:hypothetical protein